MRLTIEPAIWQRFPGLRLVVATASGLDNEVPRPAVAAGLERVQDELRAGWSHPNPQSHPRIRAWREAFKAQGVSVKKHQSSVEALCRRALATSERGTGAVPAINPLVDFYNTLSLRHLVPAGGWDVDALAGGEVTLGVSRGGEWFRELGGGCEVTLGQGEVIYRDAAEVVTRHFVWRQSEAGKIHPGTRRVFLVSEVLAAVGEGVAEAVAADLERGLGEHFGATPRVAVLAAGAGGWGA